MSPTQTWQETAAQIQKIRDESVARVPGVIAGFNDALPKNVATIPRDLLDARDFEITNQDCEELLANIRTRKLTSVAVTTAFLRRAALAQKLVNCLTEAVPESSLQRAKELDEYIEKEGKPIGPLHGLPISIKINIGMTGHTFNCGFCSQAGEVAESDALVIKILSRAGAVFHARTTGPQTLMHLETSSNLYGVTMNPYSTDLTCGGSSGGEAALQGLRGSLLGVGGDIGGSVRAPAAFCGLYGLRPTANRVPKTGCSSSMAGNEQVMTTVGPLSTSLAGIRLFMQTVLDAEPWIQEPWLNAIPWRRSTEGFSSSRPLRVAIMKDNGVVRPHPPVLRAIDEVVEKLRKDSSIEITEWTPLKHDYGQNLIRRLYFADGGQTQWDLLNQSGEPMMPLTRWIMQEQQPPLRKLDGMEVRALTKERDDYRAAYNKHWNATATGQNSAGNPTGAVDVILSPTYPGAAPPLDHTKYWNYTSQWNLMDYPALVFPASTVDAAQDLADPSYRPRNDDDAYNHKLWDPERYRDAPISLQLIGRRNDDEKLVDIMEYFEQLL